MAKEKFYLGYSEFYITNVCNLDCQGCNRFNSFRFKGYQKWHDWADVYAQWSKEIDLGMITILGGEPLLNPTFRDWVRGLRSIWPKTKIDITTNGTRLDKFPDLYKIMAEDQNMTITVSVHNKAHKKPLMKKLRDFLKSPISITADTIPYREQVHLIDANGVKAKLENAWWFHQGAVIPNEQGRLTLHNSDPIKAHAICHSRECHHWENGCLFKCGPASIFPQFDEQFKLDISDSDRQLIRGYDALKITDDYETKRKFLKEIKNPIPQCKFCPENYNGQQIFSKEKSSIKNHIRIEQIG